MVMLLTLLLFIGWLCISLMFTYCTTAVDERAEAAGKSLSLRCSSFVAGANCTPRICRSTPTPLDDDVCSVLLLVVVVVVDVVDEDEDESKAAANDGVELVSKLYVL